MDKTLVAWNEQYLFKILQFHNIGNVELAGALPMVDHQLFKDHNFLIKINSLFSSSPKYMPVDRTMATQHPFKYWIPRPWQVPAQQWTIDRALEQRVQSLCVTDKQINVHWSGGIDSTAMVTAFLKHAPNLSQIRIIYSPWSTYEHPGYVEFLKKFNGIELVDISGTVYMNWDMDGLSVSGDGGDELMASLDQSFIEKVGFDALHKPWKDFIRRNYHRADVFEFVDFCQEFFDQAQRPIDTLLQARWWFYAVCKNRSIMNHGKLPMLFDKSQVNVADYIGFFDCNEFENYIYWNIEDCITAANYATWKQVLKDYAFEFDGFEQWRTHKSKHSSHQIITYSKKKMYLKNLHWLALFNDGSRAVTPSLPVLTQREYHRYNNLQWVFNGQL